ncbi:MAG: MCP four helix bundle domain-containing protein, partial [Anaerolineae bacterium]|nr:MCP four helix bundle domain-containing protein [Anaerolineae bacterium]
VIAVFLVMAGTAYRSISGLSAEMGQVIATQYQNTALANRLKNEVGEASRRMMAVLIMTDEAQIKKELEAIDQLMTAHAATLSDLNGKAADAQTQQQLKEITGLRDKFVPAQAGFVKLVSEGSKDEALVKYMFAVRGVQGRYLAELDKFVHAQHEQMDAAAAVSATQA